jgi:hypothetical protein
VRVTEVPAFTLLAEADTLLGAILGLFTVRLSVAVLGQPVLLVVT